MKINTKAIKSVAKVAISKGFDIDEMYVWLMDHSYAFKTFGMDEQGEFCCALKKEMENNC